MVKKVERRLDRLSNESLPWLEGVVSTSSAMSWGRKHWTCFGVGLSCQLVVLALVRVDSLLKPRASDSKLMQNKKVNPVSNSSTSHSGKLLDSGNLVTDESML